jgi:hypothetical protein
MGGIMSKLLMLNDSNNIIKGEGEDFSYTTYKYAGAVKVPVGNVWYKMDEYTVLSDGKYHILGNMTIGGDMSTNFVYNRLSKNELGASPSSSMSNALTQNARVSSRNYASSFVQHVGDFVEGDVISHWTYVRLNSGSIDFIWEHKLLVKPWGGN